MFICHVYKNINNLLYYCLIPTVLPSPTLSQLREAANTYFNLASTKKSYMAGLYQYTAFCNDASVPFTPVSEDTLMLFATYKCTWHSKTFLMLPHKCTFLQSGTAVPQPITPRVSYILKHMQVMCNYPSTAAHYFSDYGAPSCIINKTHQLL